MLSEFRNLPPSNLSNEKSSQVLENSLIMKHIVRYINLFDIQRLRNTSHGIRACVDHLKPDPKVKNYQMLMRSDEFILTTVTIGGYYKTTKNTKRLNYKVTENFKDLLSRFLRDFEPIFKNQKTCMDELKLIFSYCYQTRNLENSEDSESLKTLILDTLNPMTSEFLTRFQKILEARPEPLKVQKLDLICASPSEVMQILPYLDAGSLETLKIRDPYSEYCRDFNYPESLKIPFDVEEIAKTEQWKNVKELKIDSLPITTPIQKMNLINFSETYISVNTITSEDVAYLKKNLLTSSSALNKLTIHFEKFVGRKNLFDFIGHPIWILNHKSWLFQFPTTKAYLVIDLHKNNIVFKRCFSRPRNII